MMATGIKKRRLDKEYKRTSSTTPQEDGNSMKPPVMEIGDSAENIDRQRRFPDNAKNKTETSRVSIL
jgi:hypothetical protein